MPNNTSTVKVKDSDCQGRGYVNPGFESQISAVPIPTGALPAGGTDKEMVIYQPSTDTLWDFWVAEKRVDGWYAFGGGRMQNVSKNIGIFNWPYGATAKGLPFSGGITTIEQLQSGSINHALGIALIEVRKGVHSWPANRDGSSINDSNAIPEGQRFRLDPDHRSALLP